jgi:hypothetical protein
MKNAIGRLCTSLGAMSIVLFNVLPAHATTNAETWVSGSTGTDSNTASFC